MRDWPHDIRCRRRPLSAPPVPPLRPQRHQAAGDLARLWQNFGSDRPLDTQRAIILRAFDLGVTHFDLANNYGGHTLSTSDDPLGRLKYARCMARRNGTSAASCATTCGRTAMS